MNPPRLSRFACWRWPWRTWFKVGPLLLLIALVVYGLMYLCSMRIMKTAQLNTQTLTVVMVPTPYYVGQEVLPRRWQTYLTTYFEPANRVDRALRPATWKFSTSIITTDEEFQAWGL